MPRKLSYTKQTILFCMCVLLVCLFRVSRFCCLCLLGESENEAGWTGRWGGSRGVKG